MSEIRTTARASRSLVLLLAVAFAFGSSGLSAGVWLHEHFRGSVRVLTNVDYGTPLNHGQKSVEIELPAGVQFSSFGSCGPRWVADPTIKWSSLGVQVEKYDQTTGGYAPKEFSGGWYEVKSQ